MFVRITSLAVAAAILAVATIPASANAAGEKTRALSAGYESVTVEVRTDDLNLATVSGRDSLDRRIESAAHHKFPDGTGRVWHCGRLHSLKI